MSEIDNAMEKLLSSKGNQERLGIILSIFSHRVESISIATVAGEVRFETIVTLRPEGNI